MQRTTLQDLLDNRLQTEEPSLGSDSAVTKENKQNKHHQNANQTFQHMGTVLLPWEALYEFGCMICLGFVVTFRRTPSASGKARDRQPNPLKEYVGGHSVPFGNTWSSRHTTSVFPEPVPPEGNLT